MAKVVGFSSSREVWQALESTYSHDSIEHAQNLKDSLRKLKKGNLPASDYAKQFKAICDKLTSIGQSVSDRDKSHWFLCGLGLAFETFSTAQRAIQPRPLFGVLLTRAEEHELFVSSIHGSTPSPVAFHARHNPSSHQSSRGRGRTGRSNNRRSFSARGRGRRQPHCQLCWCEVIMPLHVQTSKTMLKSLPIRKPA
ncbi:hypothetical protein L1987_57401 [Smallanthus sonchifolius]|uniref:Uncharacterized protein n=1 Tax=Smallanthus sonchifolius TaxID=185202 RepID=A0ACB9DCL4_9ASTR|nr:hypothetical protein L1987_57401 [Smallanthus sonchifolius]